MLLTITFLLSNQVDFVNGATKDEWRSRSIYQLITDRFSPPNEITSPTLTTPLPTICDPGLQTWCGGNWRSIVDRLDYIQAMGFDAIWISPTSQNIDVQTPYGFAYHSYWVNDPTKLNPRFGSSDDLKYLSSALHSRGMYLMVDVAINGIPSLTNKTDTNSLQAQPEVIWQDPADYHPICWVDYNNATSVEKCWLGDNKLALMDVNTESTTVQTTLSNWISSFVQEYGVDGLRIDAAKHIQPAFWPGFCGAAGVFCMGEVYGDDIGYAASYQTNKTMDSVLNYPIYNGIMEAFQYPGPRNMSGLVAHINGVQAAFPDPGLLGNFIENHDLPRFRNTTSDPQIAHNAMVFQFLYDGIPITYYGQEQELSNGASDPYNREAMFAPGNGNYSVTSTLQLITRLNQIRHFLTSNATKITGGSDYLTSNAEILVASQFDLAFRKGPILTVVTSRGSPSQAAGVGVLNLNWTGTVVDMLGCTAMAMGAQNSVSVTYSKAGSGGKPYVFMTLKDALLSGLCPSLATSTSYSQTNTTTSLASAASLHAPTIDLGSSALVAFITIIGAVSSCLL